VSKFLLTLAATFALAVVASIGERVGEAAVNAAADKFSTPEPPPPPRRRKRKAR
jgi:hypothetical protein